MREFATAKADSPAKRNGGLEHVDHHCPVCGGVTPLPVLMLAHGILGEWCCDHCQRAFRIEVVMEPLEVPSALNITPHPVPALPSQREDRLLALYGEELYLRSRLDDIRDEAYRLEGTNW